MAARRNSKKNSTVKLTKDGRPRRKPGPKKGWKQRADMQTSDQQPRRRPGRPRKVQSGAAVPEATGGRPRVPPQDRVFNDLIASLTYLPTIAVSETVLEGNGSGSRVLAIAPEGLDFAGIVRWTATVLHLPEQMNYSVVVGRPDGGKEGIFEFSLNEKGERIPRPAIILKRPEGAGAAAPKPAEQPAAAESTAVATPQAEPATATASEE
jgi:hypothetical protein